MSKAVMFHITMFSLSIECENQVGGHENPMKAIPEKNVVLSV